MQVQHIGFSDAKFNAASTVELSTVHATESPALTSFSNSGGRRVKCEAPSKQIVILAFRLQLAKLNFVSHSDFNGPFCKPAGSLLLIGID